YEYDGSPPCAISNEDIFNHKLKAIRFQKHSTNPCPVMPIINIKLTISITQRPISLFFLKTVIRITLKVSSITLTTFETVRIISARK
ncbi:hypothetical protein, partial [Vibrio crassostreae]|uniref:hypothetical protein n=1 Tax=Vibrio crassostreae TaxID=246167 RepID=UPI001B314F9E